MRREFEIDPNKCKHSGDCATSCPSKLIKIDAPGQLPHWIEGASDKCTRCGRCMSTCPNGAIMVTRIKEDDDDIVLGINNLLKVDPEKCKHDSICTIVCPMKLLVMHPKSKLPIPIEKAEKQCTFCGHCVAVCPHSALSLATVIPGELTVDYDGTLYYGPVSTRNMQSDECLPIDPALSVTAEQAAHFLKSRRSIRAYKDQPVGKEILTDIIETACYAPSGLNSQPVHWLVIKDREQVHWLASLVIEWMQQITEEEPAMEGKEQLTRLIEAWDRDEDLICRGAPHMIIAHTHEDTMGAQNYCTIALTYLELAAFAKGLGACWAGWFSAAADLYPPVLEALGLPEGHRSFGALLIGYPRFAYHSIPQRKKASIIWQESDEK